MREKERERERERGDALCISPYRNINKDWGCRCCYRWLPLMLSFDFKPRPECIEGKKWDLDDIWRNSKGHKTFLHLDDVRDGGGQCDQMVRLFFDIWPFGTMKVSPTLSQFFQSSLSILPNMK